MTDEYWECEDCIGIVEAADSAYIDAMDTSIEAGTGDLTFGTIPEVDAVAEYNPRTKTLTVDTGAVKLVEMNDDAAGGDITVEVDYDDYTIDSVTTVWTGPEPIDDDDLTLACDGLADTVWVGSADTITWEPPTSIHFSSKPSEFYLSDGVTLEDYVKGECNMWTATNLGILVIVILLVNFLQKRFTLRWLFVAFINLILKPFRRVNKKAAEELEKAKSEWEKVKNENG